MEMTKVTGKFDVKLNPENAYATGVGGVNLGRMALDKTFYGELEARSQGEMLSAMTAVKGSAGYVAIEQVVGKLCGRQGSFVLQHFGIMTDGQNRLHLEVVPHSGAGELTGLYGTMAISIENGQHFYEFSFCFEPASEVEA
ncbi:DUF3224 domain-containing protein [Shewanella xiamenensis]|uniref:DUF3224 domain-containing protein n=1 Tax=Shewanella xiamenensis TaxID=332186 RepID=UPI000C12B798|nr:DUF3224 domain-containing protein [Shewanella xiamenensis]MCL1071291.1 DUF3224 domain-containing protein [Shewanella xiamenensis]PHY62898.1 hypothetical protein CS023_13650 [Shewanella xiamenensis]UML92524.1 DUF3224 domain-containing protein [Shewanella xiamenensis]GGM92973.1 hypothetical protein GCM10009124_21280 [Shewanella xiamenensis]